MHEILLQGFIQHAAAARAGSATVDTKERPGGAYAVGRGFQGELKDVGPGDYAGI